MICQTGSMGWVFALLGLAVLILLHEFGHFIVAKALGMRVEKFSLFFGPKLLRLRRKETEYSLGLIPLGGYVKITGMHPRELKKLDLRLVDRTFYEQSTWKRVAVIVAGPAMNLLVAFTIMWAVAAFGPSQPDINGRGPAYLNRAVGNVRHDFDVSGLPKENAHSVVTAATISSPARAAGSGANELWRELDETVSLLPEILSNSKARGQVHSVVGISAIANERFNRSLPEALRLLALISLSLAIFNLLPIVPLDGGYIIWALAEKLRKGRISMRVMDKVSVVGFLLVLLLGGIGFSNDVRALTNGGFGTRPGVGGLLGPSSNLSLQPAPHTNVHLGEDIAAKVGAQFITKTQAERAYANLGRANLGREALSTRAAVEVPDPPDFTKCVAQMQAQLSAQTSAESLRAPRPARSTLHEECRERYSNLLESVMFELIHRAWTTQEAKALGVGVNAKRLAQALAARRESFASTSAYNQYLVSVGLTQSELERQDREAIISQELQRRLRARIASPPISEAEVSEYISRYRQFLAARPAERSRPALTRSEIRRTLEEQARASSLAVSEQAYQSHWKARTLCAPGYVVSLCSDAP
ncbi:MAG: site-2 protease family protein [Solirubrobacteraceae bacterium]